MRRIIVFLVFLVFLFLVNVTFYFLSEDYKFFLKKMKNSDEIVYIDDHEVNDSIRNQLHDWDIAVVEYESVQKIQNKLETQSWEDNLSDEDKTTSFISEEPEEILWKNYQKILDIFTKYSLVPIELTNNLFDLTQEYPDSYYEYYSKDLTLYFFNTKTYNQVYDVFDILAYDEPFSVNQVNNFGHSSFYINLNEDIQDNYIRLIINYKWVVFGLKIKKSEYNTVKQYLLQLEK